MRACIHTSHVYFARLAGSTADSLGTILSVTHSVSNVLHDSAGTLLFLQLKKTRDEVLALITKRRADAQKKCQAGNLIAQ